MCPFSLIAQMKYLSLQDYTIDDISLIGFSTYSVKTHLRIQNDTSAFAISNVSLEIFRCGELFATGHINDVYLESNGNCVYMKGEFTTVSSMAILTIFRLLARHDFSKFFIDADMKITFASGAIKHICKRGVSVGELLRKYLSAECPIRQETQSHSISLLRPIGILANNADYNGRRAFFCWTD